MSIYLAPWISDDDRYKNYWWHGTPFAYGPINQNNYKTWYKYGKIK